MRTHQPQRGDNPVRLEIGLVTTQQQQISLRYVRTGVPALCMPGKLYVVGSCFLSGVLKDGRRRVYHGWRIRPSL